MKRKNKTAGKRLSLLLLPFIATSLCSCSEKQQPQSVNLDAPFSCKAEVTKGDFSCEILISRDSEGVWQADFCAPETLSAMTVKGFGESYAIDYMGLSCTTSVTQLPAGSVVATTWSCEPTGGRIHGKGGATSFRCRLCYCNFRYSRPRWRLDRKAGGYCVDSSALWR